MVQAGDVVTFPQAPMKWNRERRYKVTEVRGDGISMETDDEDHFSYDFQNEGCERLGMTVVSEAERGGT